MGQRHKELLQFDFNRRKEDEQKAIEKKPEVPGFRLNPISPSYIMEGTEDIEDETMLKRHQKPENDEKRRKRLIFIFISRHLLSIFQ